MPPNKMLSRWRADPISFIDTVLINPETRELFVLHDAERSFLKHAFATGTDGRLLYPEQIFSCPKKSGKTTFAALFVITIVLLFGGAYPEAICAANDREQSIGRVFAEIRRIMECSPMLFAEAKINADKITIAGATIIAISNNYASAAGSNPVVAVFDELWAYTHERSRRLFDELVPPPTRKIACRLIVTYAGFEGESNLLQELYQRGLAQEEIAPNLYAGNGILMFWSHDPIAPWQTQAWIETMRLSLPPSQFLRMIENRFVTSESTFIDMATWDRCIDDRLGHTISDRDLSVWVGLDASIKHDSTAIVAVTWDQKAQQVRLVTHRIFQPTPEEPLDFEATIMSTLADLNKRFWVQKVSYDPFQLVAVAQRLSRDGLKMDEFPQTPANLTAASQNLFAIIKGRNLVVYPDADIRRAISRAIAIETPRGWRISKEKQAHKIDVVVALAMAAYAAVQAQGKSDYILDYSRWAF
jgi:phage terminase large subunit-like protein